MSVAGDKTFTARSLAWGFRIAIALSVLGLTLGLLLLQLDDAYFAVQRHLIVVYFFRDQDTSWLLLAILCLALMAWLARSGRQGASRALESRAWVVGAAVFTFAVAAGGTYLLHHDHPLSSDEFMAGFQATILGEGRLLAAIAPEWRDYATALQPVVAFIDRANGLWASEYLPVAAAIRAAFGLISLEALANPVLAALSVLAAAGIARRLWPERPEAAVLAALLLATAPQVLFMAMTAYAMPAHLALNLVWLWLFLRDDRLGHTLAPWLGVLAVGLHRLHPHALFVLPFLVPLLLSRRWRLALYYAAIYGAGYLFWLLWFDLARLGELGILGSGGEALGVAHFLWRLSTHFGLPNFSELVLAGVQLLRLLAWQNLVLVPLIAVALAGSWSALPPTVRRLAWGVLLTLLPYFLFTNNQGHGWGYRHLHGVLGSLALIAAYGWVRIVSADAGALAARARAAVLVALVAGVALALPLRAFQVEGVVRPFAAASAYLRDLDADVVLVDVDAIWFGEDLVHNDPFLRARPKIMSLADLTPAQIEALCARYSLRLVSYSDVARFGMIESAPAWDPGALPGWSRCAQG